MSSTRLFLVLACCSIAQPALASERRQVGPVLAGRERPASMAVIKRTGRAEANRANRTECSRVEIPDSAFVPVEVTGGGYPEVAVFFAHATCRIGGMTSQSSFTGTGGARIEIWSSSGSAPRLLLRHSMRGFTPTRDGLISIQHGAFCNNAPGVSLCVVKYRWRGPEDGLEVESRRLYDDDHPGTPPEPRYDWNYPLPG